MVLSLTEGDTMYTSRRAPLIVPADVRAFAKDRGLKVGTRGRFSEEVMTAYLAANPDHLKAAMEKAGVEGPKSLKKASVSRREALAEQVAKNVR
jgi:hypothetical protein